MSKIKNAPSVKKGADDKKNPPKIMQKAPASRGVDVFIGNFAINGDKNIYIALTGIMGIGRSTSEKVCKGLNLNLYEKAKNFSQDDLKRINAYIRDHDIIVGDKFRAQETARYKRLALIRCTRFVRFLAGRKNNGQTVRRRSKSCDSTLARIRSLGFI